MQSLGRYEIRGELGRGGMGIVYRAYDPTLDREVAIKSVRLDGVDEEARASLEGRLSREAKAAARLQHPNIVAVYDFFRVEDRAYIVMEFVKGSMLDAMIAGGDKQNLTMILKVLQQSASALDAAHAQGIVHRDIKPGNILLDEAGNIKITDFGIARMTTAGSTETMSSGMGSTVGTLGYMAPEQIRGEKVDGRADQFSLGIVAYQLFSGEMPFQADTWIALSYKIIHDAPPKVDGVSAGITAALERAIAKRPEDRFANCSEFTAALGGGANARKRPNVWMMAVAALVVLVGCYWIYLQPKPAAVAVVPMKTQEPIAYVPPASVAVAPEKAVEVARPELIEFVAIPPGQFFMGSDTDEADQRPRHIVKITKGFELGRTEVTEKQWRKVMMRLEDGSNLPQVNVSWNETQAFMGKLNAVGDGNRYRLPTEAEWEYAACGGDVSGMTRYAGSNKIEEVA